MKRAFDKFSRRRILQAAGVAASSLAIPSVVSSRERAANRSVRLLHLAPTNLPLWAVSYLAEDMGYYEAEALSIERIPMGNGPAGMAALLAGEADATVQTPGELLAAVAKNQNLKILMSHQNFTAYVLIVSARFSARHGLVPSSALAERQRALELSKGARLGITAPGSLTDLLTRMVARQCGLDPDKDVQIYPMQTTGGIIAGLVAGSIDGFVAPSPVVQKAIAEHGAYPLIKLGAGELERGMDLQGQAVQARSADVVARPELYAALARAELKAMRFVQEDPSAARSKLQQTRFSDLSEPVWNNVWNNELPTFRSPLVQEKAVRTWLEIGAVPGVSIDTVDLGNVIDMRFVEAGITDIGWKL